MARRGGRSRDDGLLTYCEVINHLYRFLILFYKFINWLQILNVELNWYRYKNHSTAFIMLLLEKVKC